MNFITRNQVVQATTLIVFYLFTLLYITACNKGEAILESKPKTVNAAPSIKKDSSIVKTDTTTTANDTTTLAGDTTKTVIDTTTIASDTSIVVIDSTSSVPLFNSIQLTDVSKSTASLSINLLSSLGSQIVEAGICFGNFPGVTINNLKIPVSTSALQMEAYIDNLMPATIYYARFYAKNASGIGYSNEIKFATNGEPINAGTINGTWTGRYTESSIFCAVVYLVTMDVAIDGRQFHGTVTCPNLPSYPTRILKGVLNEDSTKLYLEPDGRTKFENPWTVSGSKIYGSLKIDSTMPPDTIQSDWRYEFKKP